MLACAHSLRLGTRRPAPAYAHARRRVAGTPTQYKGLGSSGLSTCFSLASCTDYLLGLTLLYFAISLVLLVVGLPVSLGLSCGFHGHRQLAACDDTGFDQRVDQPLVLAPRQGRSYSGAALSDLKRAKPLTSPHRASPMPFAALMVTDKQRGRFYKRSRF